MRHFVVSAIVSVAIALMVGCTVQHMLSNVFAHDASALANAL